MFFFSFQGSYVHYYLQGQVYLSKSIIFSKNSKIMLIFFARINFLELGVYECLYSAPVNFAGTKHGRVCGLDWSD